MASIIVIYYASDIDNSTTIFLKLWYPTNSGVTQGVDMLLIPLTSSLLLDHLNSIMITSQLLNIIFSNSTCISITCSYCLCNIWSCIDYCIHKKSKSRCKRDITKCSFFLQLLTYFLDNLNWLARGVLTMLHYLLAYDSKFYIVHI